MTSHPAYSILCANHPLDNIVGLPITPKEFQDILLPNKKLSVSEFLKFDVPPVTSSTSFTDARDYLAMEEHTSSNIE